VIILQEVKRSRQRIKEETIQTSMRMAEELIRENYNQEDQKRAIEATLLKLKGVRL
jgi:F0F1-type ATP synthase membrane subunit b/b'